VKQEVSSTIRCGVLRGVECYEVWSATQVQVPWWYAMQCRGMPWHTSGVPCSCTHDLIMFGVLQVGHMLKHEAC